MSRDILFFHGHGSFPQKIFQEMISIQTHGKERKRGKRQEATVDRPTTTDYEVSKSGFVSPWCTVYHPVVLLATCGGSKSLKVILLDSDFRSLLNLSRLG
jgi:hypothetical protein